MTEYTIASNKWLLRYFRLAEHVSSWSKDPSTKVGAVVVGRNRKKVAFGYNGFPPGIEDTEERLNDREQKYPLTIHGERNALDNATFDLDEGLLAVTMFPCSDCAKSIISKGIKLVVTRYPIDREPWKTDSKLSQRLFTEAGVKVLIIP